MSKQELNQDVPTILFVEDEANMRNLVEKVFSEKGYIIYTAENGIKALEVLVNITPDLIISDIMMPEMDGIALFREIEALYGENRPSFIFLTAKTDEEDVINGLSMGADDYISKQVSIRQLNVKVEMKIKQIQSQRKKMTTGLRGNLDDQGLADIIQFIELAEHTGILTINFRNRQGQLQFRDGKVVWADFARLSGVEAVYALMAVDSGPFQFEPSQDIVDTNRIGGENYAMILEAMKRIDEMGRDKILEPVLSAGSEMASIPEPSSESDNEDNMDMSELLETRTSGETTTIRKVTSDDLSTSKTTKANLDPEPERVEDTGPIPVIKPREVQLAGWLEGFDFLSLANELSEIERDDLSGRWIKSEELSDTIGELWETPSCLLLISADRMQALFSIMSEVFFMDGPDDSLPLITANTGSMGTFNILGMNLNQEQVLDERLLGLPIIVSVHDSELDQLLTQIDTLIPPHHICKLVIAAESVENTEIILDGWKTQVKHHLVSGKLTSWISVLLTLPKVVKSYDNG